MVWKEYYAFVMGETVIIGLMIWGYRVICFLFLENKEK